MKKYQPIFTELKEGSSAKTMLKFIVDNSSLLDEYDLREPYERVLVAKFKKDTGFYLEKDTGAGWKVSSIKFSTPERNDYNKILKDFREFEKTSASSPKENMEKQSFKYAIDSFSMISPDVWKVYSNEISLNYLYKILYILDYVVSGSKKIPKDMSKASEIEKKIKNELGWTFGTPIMKNHPIPGMKGITITTFKNGKIQIKGLSSSQKSEIERLFNLIKNR